MSEMWISMSDCPLFTMNSLRLPGHGNRPRSPRIAPRPASDGLSALRRAVGHLLRRGEREPAADDAVEHPDAGGKPQHQRDQDEDRGGEQHAADREPEQGEPEGADLPGVVRIEPG